MVKMNKPCPFCGQLHEWEHSNDLHFGTNYSIVCGNVVLFSAYSDTMQERLTTHYNTRPIEDDLQERLTKAEIALTDSEKRLEDALNEISNLEDTRQDPYDMIEHYKMRAEKAEHELQMIDSLLEHMDKKIAQIICDKVKEKLNYTPVDKELPTNDVAKRYLVLTNGYYAQVAVYSTRTPGKWTILDRDISAYVTHWMEVPYLNLEALSNEQYYDYLGKGLRDALSDMES